MADVAAESFTSTWPQHLLNERDSVQREHESRVPSLVYSTVSDQNSTRMSQPAVAVAKVTRSSRFGEGSCDDTYPTAASNAAETIKPSSLQNGELEGNLNPVNHCYGRERHPIFIEISSQKRAVSHSPTRPKPTNRSHSVASNGLNNCYPRGQRRGSSGNVPFSQQHHFNNLRSLPQCRARSPDTSENHSTKFVDCADDSSETPQVYASWIHEIEASLSNRFSGVGNNQVDLILIFYGALTCIYSSKRTCDDDVSFHVNDNESKWFDTYYLNYFPILHQQHVSQMTDNSASHHSESKSSTNSLSSVGLGITKMSDASIPHYFCYLADARLLWNEVCKRYIVADNNEVETGDVVKECSKYIIFDDVMEILFHEVCILEKVDFTSSPESDRQQRDFSLTATIAEGVLVYVPNEMCVAFGAFLWNTYARTKLILTNNSCASPHFLMMSACFERLRPFNVHAEDSPGDILSSSWTFQVTTASSLDVTDLYSFQFLPFHCLNFVRNDTFWNSDKSISHIDFVLKKMGHLLLENGAFFASRIDSALKNHFTNTGGCCKQKVMNVIQLHIKDCEAWFKLRCEINSFSQTVEPEKRYETAEQSCVFFSEQLNLLINGYRLLLDYLERWCIDDEVNIVRQDVKKQGFFQSLNEVHQTQNERLGGICTGIHRSQALHICGQSAHLLGQSLADLNKGHSFMNKKMLPRVREFYNVALKFYELIIACPIPSNWEHNVDSVDYIGGEDRSLNAERTLILIHLGSNEEFAQDYTNAIGHYKEAVAILRNPALWRYNLTMLSGNHWGDDDESVQSNLDCKSDLSTSSLSTALNSTHNFHVSLALHRMGVCYLNSSEYGTAADCLRHAVELRKKDLLGSVENLSANNHHSYTTRRQREVDLADTLQWLATAYREDGKPERAYELIRDCLMIKLLLFGKSHIEVANVQFSMGVILDDLSRHDESLECYRDALQIQRHSVNICSEQMLHSNETLNKNETDIVNTLLCMGNVYFRVLADNRMALDFFMEALQILEKIADVESMASSVDGAKSLGGVEATYVSRDPEMTALKLAQRQENLVNHERMIQYYTISYNLVSDQDRAILILDGLSKVYMTRMNWQLALETLQKKLMILHKSWKKIGHKNDSFKDKELIEDAYEETLYNLAHMFFKLGRFKKAQQCYTDVLDAWKAHLKTQSAHSIADVLHNKGSCLKEMNLLDDAIRCYKESLKWRDGAVSMYHRVEASVFKANTWYHLGSTYLLQNNCDEAKAIFHQCIAIYKTYGNRILSEAFVLHGIGKIHQLKKESSAALDCYSMCLQIYRDVVGHDENFDPTLSKELAVFIAEAFHNVGVIHDTQKQFDSSLVNYEEALQLYRSKFKSSHCLVATTLNNMGLVLIQQQSFVDALELFKEALQIRKEKLGEDHADVAQVWYNMGVVHNKLASLLGQSSLAQAVECYKQALRIRLPIYGESNLDVSNTWNNLGISYKSLRDFDNAIGCFDKVLHIRKNLLGSDHVEVGNANHNLGNLYVKTGNLPKALEAYEISYNIRIRAFGPQHFSVANTIHNKGNVYYRLGDKERARQFYEEALKIRDSAPSSVNNKADLANSLQKVAQLEMESEQFDEALAHFERALKLKRLMFGDNYLYLASIIKATASIYHEYKHDYKQAISSYTELMRLLKWNRGEDDVEVAQALNMLGYIYSKKECDQFNLSMAVDCHEAALKALPRNSDVYAKALCNIAICSVNMLQGEGHQAIPTGSVEEMTVKAIRCLESCIAIYENTAQDSYPASSQNIEMMSGLAKSLYYKGVLHMQFSGFSKNAKEDEHAIDCFEEALALSRELLKSDSVAHASATSGVMQKLGMMWIKRRDYDQAMSYFREALKIRDHLQGSLLNADDENNKEMAEIYYGMGVVLCERRDRNYGGAMECYKKSLQIRMVTLGPHHIDVAQTLNNIGSVYARMNKFSDAKDYWSKALDLYRSDGLDDSDEKVKCTVSNMELADKLVIFPSKQRRRSLERKY